MSQLRLPQSGHCCWKMGTAYSGPMWCGKKAKAVIRDPWGPRIGAGLQLEVCGIHLRKAERTGIKVIRRYDDEAGQ